MQQGSILKAGGREQTTGRVDSGLGMVEAFRSKDWLGHSGSCHSPPWDRRSPTSVGVRQCHPPGSRVGHVAAVKVRDNEPYGWQGLITACCDRA